MIVLELALISVVCKSQEVLIIGLACLSVIITTLLWTDAGGDVNPDMLSLLRGSFMLFKIKTKTTKIRFKKLRNNMSSNESVNRGIIYNNSCKKTWVHEKLLGGT